MLLSVEPFRVPPNKYYYFIHLLLKSSNFLVDPNRLMGLLTSSPFSSIAVTPFISSAYAGLGAIEILIQQFECPPQVCGLMVWRLRLSIVLFSVIHTGTPDELS